MTNKSENKQVAQSYTYNPPTSSDLLEEFEKNHRSYQLFKELGLDKDKAGVHESVTKQGQPMSSLERILDEGLFRRLRRDFLTNVDLAKGPIERKVVKLERRKGLNPESRKSQEYLVTHVMWMAKDYLGNDLVSVELLEGMHNQPKTSTTIVKGKKVTQYQNWLPVYDIPFTVDAVNQTLENQVNPPELIKYMVRTSQSERDDSYSLEQFRDSTFEECIEIHKQGKGANR